MILAASNDSGLPWEMFIYLGIGFPVAVWYRRKKARPPTRVNEKLLLLQLTGLACIWPILVVSVLIQRRKLKQETPDDSGRSR